ncbi:hypothetical protein [Paenibacillus pabuli]|uniref:Uncharacterized protein n=2 Tax=Paenibacillus TaxID=44249 RepID=A0A855YCG4_9BACL|nr:hypothetical protein [Paenibacillus pabuli]PWW43873.1 hypothetical protein DET56_102102 [Paenibacillus pabuli]PXW09902.1 hypothetical protein DEU73_102102 [Paenibacillus taichungensis]
MDKKCMRVLKKLYLHTNGDYDRAREVMIYQTDTLTAAEQELLTAQGWVANDLELIHHDDILQQLIAIQQNERLSWSTITQAFIASVGGSYPRGISTLASYHMMIHSQMHAYEETEQFLACRVCGFSHSDEGWKNLSIIRYALHQGYDYSGTSVGAYADLTEFVTLLEQGPIKPTPEDIRTFNQLLYMLDQADAEESPGKFEKRLTAEKLVKGHAGIRRSILQALSRVGVLPNQVLSLNTDHWTNNEHILNGELQLSNTKGRSDMQMPWAGWQGKLGVDWDKARKLFGHVIQVKD